MKFLYLTIDVDGDAVVYGNGRTAVKMAKLAREEQVDVDVLTDYPPLFYTGDVRGLEQAFGVTLVVGTVETVEVRAYAQPAARPKT